MIDPDREHHDARRWRKVRAILLSGNSLEFSPGPPHVGNLGGLKKLTADDLDAAVDRTPDP